MLKDHQDLLEQIRKTEALAVRLYKKGPAIGETISALRKAGNAINERVKHYTKEAKEAEAEKKDEPKQEPQQSVTPPAAK